MTIETHRDIGDTVVVNGVEKEIKSIHIYISGETYTERYYFGDAEWYTELKEKTK